MQIIQLQIAPWDRIFSLNYDGDINLNDKIIVKTDFGLEIAKVVDILSNEQALKEGLVIEEDFFIERKATNEDLEKNNDKDSKEKEIAMSYCQNLIEQKELNMKLIDILFSFDGSHITFAFASDSRVDFRSLVRDLAKYFNKAIKMQQIGARDQSRVVSDQGCCGRGTCCSTYIKKFFPINGEMAEAQNLSNRGGDRLSGVCGRLKCCLSYEFQGYKEKQARMPAIGTKVNVDGKFGIVVGHHLLKESVDVKFNGEKGEDDVVLEIDLNRNKK